MAVCHASALPISEGVPVAGLVESILSYQTSPAPFWSHTQYAIAMTMALIDGSAAVQTTTGQNKRHWHVGGRLTRGAAATIVAEAVGQCVLVGHTFTRTAEDAIAFSACTGAYFIVALLLLWAVPLHAQRPLSVLLFLAALQLASDGAGLLPPTPGLGWARVVLPTKYLLSHPVRHEPYRE